MGYHWPSKLSAIIDERLHGPWRVPLGNAHGQICICELRVVVYVQVFAHLLILRHAPFACSRWQEYCKLCGTTAAGRLAHGQSVYNAKSECGHLVCLV